MVALIIVAPDALRKLPDASSFSVAYKGVVAGSGVSDAQHVAGSQGGGPQLAHTARGADWATLDARVGPVREALLPTVCSTLNDSIAQGSKYQQAIVVALVVGRQCALTSTGADRDNNAEWEEGKEPEHFRKGCRSIDR